jgi:hypothetical protein
MGPFRQPVALHLRVILEMQTQRPGLFYELIPGQCSGSEVRFADGIMTF